MSESSNCKVFYTRQGIVTDTANASHTPRARMHGLQYIPLHQLHTMHSGSGGVADIMSVTMPLSSIKKLSVATSTRAEPAC